MKYLLLIISLLSFTGLKADEKITNLHISNFNKALIEAIEKTVKDEDIKTLDSTKSVVKLDEKITDLSQEDKWVMQPYIFVQAPSVFWDKNAKKPTTVKLVPKFTVDSKKPYASAAIALEVKTNYLSLFQAVAKHDKSNSEFAKALTHVKNREELFNALKLASKEMIGWAEPTSKIAAEKFSKLLDAQIEAALKTKNYRINIDLQKEDLRPIFDDIRTEKFVLDFTKEDAFKFEWAISTVHPNGVVLLESLRKDIQGRIVGVNSKDAKEVEKAKISLSLNATNILRGLDMFLSGNFGN